MNQRWSEWSSWMRNRGMPRGYRTIAVFGLFLCAGATQAQAPETGTRVLPSSPPALPALQGGARHAVADMRVTVNLQNVSLEQALHAIQESAGVTIAYGDRIVPLTRRVSLVVADLPVLLALRQVLDGTGVDVKVSPNGKIVLVDSAVQDSTQGYLEGLVVDVESKVRLALVQLSLQGSTMVAATQEDGRFAFARIPAGTYVVRARLLGYAVAQQTVTIRGGQTVSVTFALSPLPTQLQEVVTTGSGDRRRVEVGNAISTINADSIVRTTPLRNLADLLQARAPGMQVLSMSGTVGSASRIRIRGVSSIMANSDPIVIIDGVRVDAATSAPGITQGGGLSAAENSMLADVMAASRLNDIDPEMIESIDILKGPSAATLYGSDAANGVIVIKTKRGRPGPTRWSFSTTQGWSTMKATFLEAWQGWGSSDSNPALTNCTLVLVAARTCVQDSVTRYNPLNYDETTPWGTGRTGRYNAQVSGGSAQVQYFLGASYNDDVGLLKMPSAEAEAMVAKRGGVALPEWATRPNVLSGTHLTSTVSMQPNSRLDLALNASYVDQYHRDARQGVNGFVTQSYSTPGYRDTIGFGWGSNGPGQTFLQRASDQVNRFTAGIQSNARPTSALSLRGTAGIDRSVRHDESLLRAVDLVTSTQASRGRTDTDASMITADVGGVFTVSLTNALRLRSSVGGQYTRSKQSALMASYSALSPGEEVIPSVSASLFGREMFNESATAGWYIDESLSVLDRVFFTMALRGDAGSSFGRNAKAILYPKFNASWLISQEPFFPKIDALNNLRLRAAFGQAGVQPSVDARFRSYQRLLGSVNGAEYQTIIPVTIGNTALEPERSAEIEGGIDVGLWEDRVTIGGTLYYKFTTNALVTRNLPPSLGIASRQENVGSVENRGTEVEATVRPLVNRTVDWSLTFGWSSNSNKLVTLTNASLNNLFSQQTRYAAGYPIGGFWSRKLVGYNDANGDGIITTSEIQMTDSAFYMGSPLPKSEVSLHNNVALFGGRMTVGAGFSYVGGQTTWNRTLYMQCTSGRCRQLVDPATSLAAQAIVQSALGSTLYGSFERASWLRWNDLSVTMYAPESITRAFRSRTVSVSVMGRNLYMWSKYRGADPEVNSEPLGNYTVDSGGIPQTRDWSIRLNLNF